MHKHSIVMIEVNWRRERISWCALFVNRFLHGCFISRFCGDELKIHAVLFMRKVFCYGCVKIIGVGSKLEGSRIIRLYISWWLVMVNLWPNAVLYKWFWLVYCYWLIIWCFFLGVGWTGNLGNMLLIIIPAVCKEKGSPFGNSDVCRSYGLAYASLSMAVSSFLLSSFHILGYWNSSM